MKLLGDVIVRVDGGEQQVAAGALIADPADAEARNSLSADARALGDQGLLTIDERLGGAWLARLTPAGRDAWEEFELRRADKVQRAAQLRNNYLRWLYDNAQSGGYAVSDHFLESGAAYLDDPYSMDELMAAGRWLADREFIEGPGVDQRPDPVHARPTSKGEDYVEKGWDVRREANAESSVSYNVVGPTQIAHGSHHFVQVQGKDQGREQALTLAAAIEQMLATVPKERRDEIAALATDLREEAEGGGRVDRFREIGGAATKAFSSGAGGALGATLISAVSTWLGNLG
jgi:hypothetical protein